MLVKFDFCLEMSIFLFKMLNIFNNFFYLNFILFGRYFLIGLIELFGDGINFIINIFEVILMIL